MHTSICGEFIIEEDFCLLPKGRVYLNLKSLATAKAILHGLMLLTCCCFCKNTFNIRGQLVLCCLSDEKETNNKNKTSATYRLTLSRFLATAMF